VGLKFFFFKKKRLKIAGEYPIKIIILGVKKFLFSSSSLRNVLLSQTEKKNSHLF